eukprot:gene11150-10435_t
MSVFPLFTWPDAADSSLFVAAVRASHPVPSGGAHAIATALPGLRALLGAGEPAARRA